MKLSVNESKVLSVLHLEAEAPTTIVSKMCKLPMHTVQYCLRSLIERELIAKVPYINSGKLGLTSYGVLLSINTEERNLHQRFKKRVSSTKGVTYFAELGGEYQYYVAIATRTPVQLREFFDMVSLEFGPIVFRKDVVAQIELHDYKLSYLLGDRSRVDELGWGVTTELVDVDSIDRAILSALSRAGGRSNREVARKLGLASSTFEFRVRRLEKSGVIVGYRYLIDTLRLGVQSFTIGLTTRGLSRDFRNRIQVFSQKHRHVRFLIETVGGWDFELGVETFDTRLMSSIVLDIYERFGREIVGLRVCPIFNTLKVENYPY
jgi:DNA-binding Lrp family transcriptional regulator